MVNAVLNGFILGFISSPTCPSNAEEARWGSRYGLGAALLVGAGAIAGDAVVLLFTLLGLYPLLLAFPSLERVLWLAGSFVLGYLAWGMLREARQPDPAADELDAAASPRLGLRPFFRGLLITALNPFTFAWWIGLLGVSSLSSGDLPILFAGAVLAGSLAWFVGLAGLLHFSRGKISEGARRWMLVVGALVMFGYASWLAVEGLTVSL
ncbi:MAG: LysE family transporter [Trueperaceae bacterium]